MEKTLTSLNETQLQEILDTLSDNELERIEELAQATRKKRKKKWASFEELVEMYDN